LPLCFVSSSNDTVICTIDSEGVARLDNGELPKLKMPHHPGDNCRVAAVLVKADGSPLSSGQDLSVLQVDDSTQPGYVPPSSAYPKKVEFAGGLSPMLTVWRKLNIEIDSMEAVPESGPEKNFEEGTVLDVMSISDLSIVTVDILLTPNNRFENGFLTTEGGDYEVNSNAHYWITLLSGDEMGVTDVVVKGTVPTTAVGKYFKIVDDDDRYLDYIGLMPPLPKNGAHADIIQKTREKFAPAYIQLEDANAHGWNPNQTIPFKLHAPVDTASSGSVFNEAKDLTDSDAFWAFTVTFGYQPATNILGSVQDGDPDTEARLLGGTPKSRWLWSYASKGFAAIFVETIRDYVFRDLRSAADKEKIKTNVLFQKNFRNRMYNWLLGIIVHEIGHSPGGQTESGDHEESGIMKEEGDSIDGGFTPGTIKRFRDTKNWTH